MPRSGDGNGFGTRYAEDFRLLAEHGLTHHRLSIEWARIEPRPGEVSPEKGRGRGLISVCTAGGMGVTAILEAA